MTDLSVTILPETADDALAIDRLHERTFGPGRFARTTYRVRERTPHLLSLSFTARIGTLLVGSVRLSPIRVEKLRHCCLARSPSSRRSVDAESEPGCSSARWLRPAAPGIG